MKQINNWNSFFLHEAKLEDFSIFHEQKKTPKQEFEKL